MADISKTIEIIFGAVDHVSGTADGIGKSLNTFDSSVQSVAGPLGNLTENLLKAETAISALAAAYGVYAVGEAAKFQSAQIDLNKVLDESDPSIESFTKTVNDLSETYGVSATEVLKGIANFKEAGFSAKEAADLQKNAMDLMIAGDVDASQASEILVASLKGMGAGADEAGRFLEALNNVSNSYATNVDQLSEGMSKVAPILKIMGFSFEEGIGVITPIIEVFREGGVAADAMKTGLLKLLDDSAPVKAALGALGVSQLDLNGKMRSGKDIFYDVAASFQHLDENQKLVFASQLVGNEQAGKMVLAFNDLKLVNEVTATAMEKTGSVAKEVELRLASAEKQIDRLKEGFVNLSRVLGSEILGEFAGIIGGATDVENAFRKVVEAGGLDPLFNALKPQMAEFEQTLRTMAKNLPNAFQGIDFSGLLDAFGGLGEELKTALSAIFGNVDLTTVEGLRDAIQTTINIITSLVNATKGIVDQFSPIFDAIGEAGKQVGGASDESAKAAGQLLGAMTILKDFGTALGIVILALKQSEADITNVFNAIVGGGRLFTNSLQIAFDVMALAIVGAMEDVVFAIGAFLNGIGATDAAKSFTDSGQELKLTAAGIKENLNSNANDIKDAWSQMTDGLAGGANKSADSLQKIGDAAKGSKQPIGELSADATNMASAFIGLAQGTGFTAQGLDEIGGAAGLTADQLDYLILATDKYTNSSGRTSEEINKIVASMTGISSASSDAVGSFNTLAAAEAAAVLEIDKGKTTSITFADGLYTLHSVQGNTAKSADDLAKATKNAADAAKTGSAEWKNVQQVMLESQKISNDFSIKLGELANKKYEIDVKANVDIKTAEIEAQTQRIQAAFAAVTDTIGALAPEVTNLWALFSNKAGFVGSKELEAAAKAMEARLDRELELKTKLTEATVENLNARTDRLINGDALISIDSGDLAPELDALFEKVLKRVQIKGTEEGLNLLLGLGAD